MRPRHRLRRASVLALAGLLSAAIPALATGPGAVQVTGSSPYYDTNCTADAVGSQSGTNNPNTEVEPTLAVNPTNPNNLVGAWHQDRWSNGGSRGDVLARSFDGGATWTTFRIPGIAICDGGQWPRGTDPWLSFAPNGRLYFVSQSFDDANALTAFMISTSTDGGLTWSTAVPVSYRTYGYPHFTYDDKVSLTADPTDPTDRTAYLVWDRFSDSPTWYKDSTYMKEHFKFNGGFSAVWMSKTTDGGATWTKPSEVYRPGTNNYTGGPIVAVQPNGTVVLGVATWFQSKGGSSWTTYAMFKQSTNGGKTWSTAYRGPRMSESYLYDPQGGDWLRTGSGLLDSVGDPTSGKLWLTWEDGGADNLGANVLVSSSGDGGIRWTTPVEVDGSSSRAFTPMIAVAPGGAVGVTFASFRRAEDEVSQWVATCSSACGSAGSWSQVQVGGATTDGTFQMRWAPNARGLFLGDYSGFVANAAGFHSLYSLPPVGPGASVVSTDLWYSFVATP